MRTRHWLARLLGGMLAIAGTEPVWAQMGPEGAYFNDAPPGYTGGYSGMEAAGYPPGAQPWPAVSPFAGPPVDQTRNEQGLWYRSQKFGSRRYFADIEMLLSFTGGPPKGPLGANGVNVIQNFPGVVSVDHNQLFFEKPFTVAGPGRENADSSTDMDLQVFPSFNMGLLSQTISAGGVRGRWGFWNPDDTGFMISGWYQGQGSSSFQFADPALDLDPFSYNNSTTLAGTTTAITSFTEHLHAYLGLPLTGYDSDGDGQTGTVIPFDIAVGLKLESRIIGAAADYYFGSWIDSDNIKVRGLAGGRYLNIGEDFQFAGLDSGMGYTIQNEQGTAGGTGGGTDQSAGKVNGTPVALEPGFNIPDVMKSYLRSNLKSDLGGPEIGIRVDLGSDNFLVWTETKFGLLANQARRYVEGYNIGDAYSYLQDPSIVTYDAQGDATVGGVGTIMPRHDIPSTQFRDNSTTTYISPMFEQSIYLRTKPFGYIPGARKIRALSEANFQLGYSFLMVGGVYRPSNNINWDAWPVNPSLADKRSTFYTNNINLGLEWAY